MSNLHQRDPRRNLDRAARLRAHRTVLPAALLATLVACHTPSPRVTAPDRGAVPPNTPQPEDGRYDWHALLIAPFGSVLKDIPVALHEVLLFRDEVHGNEAADDAECYAADEPGPRFLGRAPDEYLLCFKQDRLSRILASVRLTAAEAPEVFAAACASWLKDAAATPGAPSAPAPSTRAPGTAGPSAPAPSTPAPGTAGPSAPAPSTPAPGTAGPSAPAPSTVPPTGVACDGRDGAIRFTGRLGEDSSQAETLEAETLSITLDGVPDP
jgi:hypothetical protein